MSSIVEHESKAGSTITPEVIAQFQDILKSNGITEQIFDVIVENTNLNGENWGGLTENVEIKFKNRSKEPLYLYVKKKPTNNVEYCKMLDKFQAYQKEVVFFMECLPRARQLCKSVGHEDLMDIYPKGYYGDDNMLMLENLVLGRGFVMLDKEEGQDFETAQHSLITLAKHNAISHALIQELGGPTSFFHQFPQLENEITDEFCKELVFDTFENGIDINIKILEKCGIDGSDKAVEILTSLKGKHFDQFAETLKTKPGEFLVLTHGDYWNNNMMFRINPETNETLEHVIVDFQNIKHKSPCIDISNFLFTSVKPEVRRERLCDLLRIYFDALKTFANDLGHTINISVKEFEIDFCKHFYYGYWYGMDLISGAAHKAMQEIGIDESSDMIEMNEKYIAAVEKWVDEHPEECKAKAQDIIEYVSEYDRLSNFIII